jgi:hypothetical protein
MAKKFCGYIESFKDDVLTHARDGAKTVLPAEPTCRKWSLAGAVAPGRQRYIQSRRRKVAMAITE